MQRAHEMTSRFFSLKFFKNRIQLNPVYKRELATLKLTNFIWWTLNNFTQYELTYHSSGAWITSNSSRGKATVKLIIVHMNIVNRNKMYE